MNNSPRQVPHLIARLQRHLHLREQVIERQLPCCHPVTLPPATHAPLDGEQQVRLRAIRRAYLPGLHMLHLAFHYPTGKPRHPLLDHVIEIPVHRVNIHVIPVFREITRRPVQPPVPVRLQPPRLHVSHRRVHRLVHPRVDHLPRRDHFPRRRAAGNHLALDRPRQAQLLGTASRPLPAIMTRDSHRRHRHHYH